MTARASSKRFVPARIVGGTVLVEQEPFLEADLDMSAAIRWFRGVELVERQNATRRLTSRWVEVCEPRPFGPSQLGQRIPGSFRRVVDELVALAGTPAPALLQAFGSDGMVHAVVAERLEGLELDRLVRELHAHGEYLPIPVVLGIGRALVPLWSSSTPFKPSIRLCDVVLSSTGRVRARLDPRDPSYFPYWDPQALHHGLATEASCMYLLGVLLYEMLVGLPFTVEGMSMPEVIQRQLDPLPPIEERRQGLQPGVAAFVDRAIAHRPGDRFVSWSELVAELVTLQSSFERMGPEELRGWLQALPKVLHPRAEPPPDVAALGDWPRLPSSGWVPVPVPTTWPRELPMLTFTLPRNRLPMLPWGSAPTTPWPKVGRGGVSFSDDLARSDGGRIAVRARITDRDGGGYCIDLRDSDEPDSTVRFALARERTLTSCLLALGHALGEPPTRGWIERVELITDPRTWIDADDLPCDPIAIAMGMARTFDAVLGAFGNAWPGRVGAGSCSLGVVVELRAHQEQRYADGPRAGELLLTEVLPGGEGGRPDRPGEPAWPGPILASTWDRSPTIDGLTIEGSLREGSGGGGKRSGGDGIIRRYHVHRPLLALLAFDRVRNPPHGIDRAGPPLGTEVWLHLPDADRPRAVEPWTTIELPPGSLLEVLTCGGAGWGFPGYGDIEWDPSEWFGGKPKTG